MKRLAIVGASGQGKVVAELAELVGWKHIDFFDERWPEIDLIGPWEVVGTTESLIESATSYDGAIIAIGNNDIRLDKQSLLEQNGIRVVSLVHPTAVVSKYSTIAEGTVVMANVVINPFVTVGKGCIVNTAATIDHDCLISDGAHISPGVHLAGAVSVGKKSWIGIGACIKQLIHIGQYVTVGAGAAVVSNIESNLIVAGVPAKPLDK